MKQARKLRGLTAEQVADRMGVSRNNVFYWESDHHKPRADQLPKLAEHLGVTVDWLLGRDVPAVSRRPVAEAVEELIGKVNLLVEVPLLGRVPAGQPTLAPEDQAEHIAVPMVLVQGVRRPFALTISGNSLRHLGINDGETVFVDPDAELVDGKLYIVLVGNEVTAKRVSRQGGRLRLEGADGELMLRELDEVQIRGRIVARWQRL